MKKEYLIRFARRYSDEDSLAALSSFWKLLWWLIRIGRHCERIAILYTGGNMRIHELKCENSFFQEIIDGAKPFEVRRNDRLFQVGDILALNEIQSDGTYTGRCCVVEVCTILDDARFCKEGFVVMGIHPAAISTMADRSFEDTCLRHYSKPVLGEL